MDVIVLLSLTPEKFQRLLLLSSCFQTGRFEEDWRVSVYPIASCHHILAAVIRTLSPLKRVWRQNEPCEQNFIFFLCTPNQQRTAFRWTCLCCTPSDATGVFTHLFTSLIAFFPFLQRSHLFNALQRQILTVQLWFFSIILVNLNSALLTLCLLFISSGRNFFPDPR